MIQCTLSRGNLKGKLNMSMKSEVPLSPIGKEIQKIRVRKNIEAADLTRMARIDSSQMWRIMHGASKPSYKGLLKICRALSCSIEEVTILFSFTQFRTPTPEELNED